MNKLLSMALVASIIAAGSNAFAAEKLDTKTTTTHTTTTKATPATPAATTEVKKTEETVKTEAKPVTAELNDGTKIEIGSDAEVSTINSDGSKTPAPDGVLTLKDGVTITIKGGKKVSQ